MNKIEYKTDKPLLMSLVSTNGRIAESGYMKLVLTEDLWSSHGHDISKLPEYRGGVFDVSKGSFNETILNGLIQIVSVRALAEDLNVEKSLDDFSSFLTDYINNKNKF